MSGRLIDITLRGTRAAQPAATATPPGALYFVTDENVTERVSDDGTAWVSYSGSGAGSGTVTNTGTLTSGTVILGNGGVDVTALAMGTAGQVLTVNAGATAAEWAAGGSGTPGGSNTQVQYNNAGAFGGITGATTNGTALTLVAPVLGTPASGTLTNCTGLPISTGVSGLGTGVATFLGTPSSANLASAVTDETGSGALVFATSPTLVTPALGTPSSGTLTNCTGLPIAGGGTGQTTATAAFDALAPTTTAGDVIYHNGTDNVRLGIGTASQVLAVNAGATAPEWTTIAGTGDVVGPASATDNAIVRFDGTTGKLVQNSAVTIADSTGVTTGMVFPNTGLNVQDTNASHTLGIVPGSDLTANRTLTVTTGDSDRTFTLTANSSIGGTAYVVGGTDVAVADGGTGLSSGTSGGVLGYTASGTLASSAELVANALVIGGGAGATPSTTTTGTGVITALGVNVGSAGAVLVNGGALGTPSSGTMTNVTGIVTAGINNSQVTLAKIQNAGANSRWLGSGSGGSGAAYTENTFGAGLTVGASSVSASTAVITKALGITIDGGGSAITTGIKGDLYVPFACTITAATMLADQSGSIVVDIWKDTYANYPPTDADSITSATPPTISTATKSQDTTLSSWTTSISAGDTLRFNVDSVTTITRVQLTLTVTVS